MISEQSFLWLDSQDPPDVFDQVRLIVTDVDGTLTLQGKLTASVLQSLADLQKAGFTLLLSTGRSAGWVQGLRSYLPVDGAIAENGGVLFLGEPESLRLMCSIESIEEHRQRLAAAFAQIQRAFPHYPDLTASSDNRFRLTDWTFEQRGFSPGELRQMADICLEWKCGFTYSSVQCHINSLGSDKGSGLSKAIESTAELRVSAHEVLTVGDSPNDESLFDRNRFPVSVGVANLLPYRDQLKHLPRFVVPREEGMGFQDLARALLSSRSR